MLKTLSNIFLILNPICGLTIIVLCCNGGWYLFGIPVCILIVVLVLKFHFKMNPETAEQKKWRLEHNWLGECYGIDYWQNIQTGKIIEA